jgi:hypothetical protein
MHIETIYYEENSMKHNKFCIRIITVLAIIMLLLAILPVSLVYADNLGPRNAGAGADVAGIGTVTWGSPGNISTVGSPYATMSVPASAITHYLQGTQYGFTIPSGSTINGITVVINRQSSGRTAPFLRDNVVRLVKGGAITGNNKALTGTNWPNTGLGTATYGSSTDLWGTTWTAEEINANNFGVVLSAVNAKTTRARTATVDYIQITVYYNMISTSTTVNCGGGTPVVTYGSSITCVASVRRAAGVNTPSGTVTWTSSGSGLFTPSSCTLSGTGGTSTCSVNYTPSSIGSSSHLISATYGGDVYFTGSSGAQTVTVNKRPITVTADAKSKVYGNADPAFTYHITSGSLVFGDTFSGALNRTTGEAVGSYAINQGTLALSSNYILTYVGANLTITKRPITVTADAKSKAYGDADPALSYQVTSGSLVFGDTISGALTRAAGESLGTHAILQGSLALSDNYNLTYVGANLTITKRPITITADAKSKVYGDADPTLTYQVTSGSLLSGDTFSGALTRAAGEAAGNHAILQGTLALPDIYNLTYVGSNLTITKRPITVTADAKSKVYGDADPTLTYQVTSGSLVFGDSFSGALTRAAGEAAGNHAILQGTLALSGNYDLTYVGANLTITKANPTCYITPYNLIYDGDPHAATGACTGVNNEPLSGLDLSETNHTNAGNYSEDPWSFIDTTGNYTDTQGTVDNSIAKVAPTCMIDGYAGIYDGELYGATGSCTGVKGEGLTGLDLGDSFMDVPGGTAYWTFTDGTGNYNDNSGSVDIVISRADATCSIDGYTGVYDGELHSAAGSCTGVKGEVLTGLDLGDTFMDVPGGTAYWTFTDGTGNYNDNSGSVDIVISTAEATCSIDGYTGVYDGELHGAAGSCTGVQGEDLTGLDLGDSFMDVPGGTAYWTFTGNGNYNDQSGEASIVITPTDASCNVIGYTSVYDAAFHGASGSCSGIGGENPGTLDLGETFKNVPGGTAEWTLTGNNNYKDQNGEASIEISKADAVCECTPYTFEYDREEHTATGRCTGVEGEELAGLDLTGTTHIEIGDYTDDPWTFADVTGNYRDANGTVNDEIILRAITVTADAKSKVIGQTDPALTFQTTSGELLSGDAFVGELTRQPGENVGIYAILQGTLTLPDYYEITYVGAYFTITGSMIYLPLIHR